MRAIWILATSVLLGCGPGVEYALHILTPPVREVPTTLAPKPIPEIENPEGAVEFDPVSYEEGDCFGIGDLQTTCPPTGILVSEHTALQFHSDKAAAVRLLAEAKANHSVALSATNYITELHLWVEDDLPDEFKRSDDVWYVKYRGTMAGVGGVIVGGGLVALGAWANSK